MSLSKTPYRGNRKAYVLLEEARALKVLKGAHIKIGRVSCRVRRKKEVNRCFCCLGFGHSGELTRARLQQVLLEMRRGEASCKFLHRDAEMLPLCPKEGKSPE